VGTTGNQEEKKVTRLVARLPNTMTNVSVETVQKNKMRTVLKTTGSLVTSDTHL
jgi:hypothetical protein